MITTLEVNRNDLTSTRLAETAPAPSAQTSTQTSTQLADGEVLARVSQFALTSNNVTYAVIGEGLGYWNFFPAAPADDGVAWGRVPAFGYAEIEESRCPEVAEGGRIYGYFPMATHVVMQPGDVSDRAFIDRAPHRQPMSEVYNRYTFAETDALHDPEREAQRMLLYPLFATAFVIDDFFADGNLSGPTTAVISSASSKTAIGTAHLMNKRDGLHLIGLTSAGNRAFVEGLGCYDEVRLYDQAAGAPGPTSPTSPTSPTNPAIYIDISGSGTVRRAVHSHFADSLAYSTTVGVTAWTDMAGGGDDPLPGPAPEFFFAPAEIAKRNEAWGAEEYERRVAEAWATYSDWTDSWLEIVHHRGAEVLATLWAEMVSGHVDPTIGHVVSLNNAP